MFQRTLRYEAIRYKLCDHFSSAKITLCDDVCVHVCMCIFLYVLFLFMMSK